VHLGLGAFEAVRRDHHRLHRGRHRVVGVLRIEIANQFGQALGIGEKDCDVLAFARGQVA